MKVFLLFPLLITGCLTIPDVVPAFDNPNKINESNYMKTPCIVDGAVVKKKPKVNNIDDSNTVKGRKEG